MFCDELSRQSVSVVVPVRDEAQNVHPLLERIITSVGICLLEVIVVDDGSRDGTAREVTRYSDLRVRLVRLKQPLGQDHALHEGLRLARGRCVVTLDGDLQNQPEDIPSLLSASRHCTQAVFGYRSPRIQSMARRIVSRIGNGFANVILRERVSDRGCSLRCVPGSVARRLPDVPGLHVFMRTYLDCEVEQIRVSDVARVAGLSHYSGLRHLRRAPAWLVCAARHRRGVTAQRNRTVTDL